MLALDGFGVSSHAPYWTEVIHLKDYRLRKSGFAIIILAECDINARFISASCNHSGSTNIRIAWQETLLFQMLEVEKQLPSKYFFIGDEAFNTTQQFLSPCPGKSILLLCNNIIQIICFMVLMECCWLSGHGLDIYKNSFNYWLSHSQQAVEHAFGMLTQWFENFLANLLFFMRSMATSCDGMYETAQLVHRLVFQCSATSLCRRSLARWWMGHHW
jgi:hypothetical protein